MYIILQGEKKPKLFSSWVISKLLLMSFEILSQSLHCLSKNEVFLLLFNHLFSFLKETNIRAYNQ